MKLTDKILKAVFLFIFMLGHVGCQKKWKETTQLDVSLRYDTVSPVAGLTISSVSVNLDKIRFNGDRKQGGKVVFETRPANPVIILNTSGTRVISCDLPQGDYGQILFDVSLSRPDTDPVIVVNAIYTDSSGVTKLVVIDISTAVYTESIVRNSSGGQNVSVRTGRTSSIMVALPLQYWLQNIGQDDLEDADCEQGSGSVVIYIDKDHNADIYQHVIDRLNVPPVIIMQ